MIEAIDQKFEQVVKKIDPQSKLHRTWKLTGGVSAQVTALEMMRPDGRTQKMIVRWHGGADLERNPCIAADEFRLLQQLHSTGLSVPMPYYLDQSNEIFATPYVVVEYIEGKPEFAPANLTNFLLQFATYLAKIHQLDCSNLDLSFLPEQAAIVTQKLSKRPATLDDALSEGHIRDILEAAWPLAQRNQPVLLHGDFWPGNLLWHDGQLAAVIDWEDAALGDPLVDVANSRLELLWAFGSEAMDSFTQHYQSLTSIDFTDLPYWELYAALRPASKLSDWGLDAATEKRMHEQHHWFIMQAFDSQKRPVARSR